MEGFCPRRDCKRAPAECGKKCVCRPCRCLPCRERTMKATDPRTRLYRPQDHASAPARQELVERRLAGTPVTELESPQGALF
jgi:hypothetical protein